MRWEAGLGRDASSQDGSGRAGPVDGREARIGAERPDWMSVMVMGSGLAPKARPGMTGVGAPSSPLPLPSNQLSLSFRGERSESPEPISADDAERDGARRASLEQRHVYGFRAPLRGP